MTETSNAYLSSYKHHLLHKNTPDDVARVLMDDVDDVVARVLVRGFSKNTRAWIECVKDILLEQHMNGTLAHALLMRTVHGHAAYPAHHLVVDSFLIAALSIGNEEDVRVSLALSRAGAYVQRNSPTPHSELPMFCPRLRDDDDNHVRSLASKVSRVGEVSGSEMLSRIILH